MVRERAGDFSPVEAIGALFADGFYTDAGRDFAVRLLLGYCSSGGADTGEVLAKKGSLITESQAMTIQNAGVNVVELLVGDQVHRVVGNNFADAADYLPVVPSISSRKMSACPT